MSTTRSIDRDKRLDNYLFLKTIVDIHNTARIPLPILPYNICSPEIAISLVDFTSHSLGRQKAVKDGPNEGQDYQEVISMAIRRLKSMKDTARLYSMFEDRGVSLSTSTCGISTSTVHCLLIANFERCYAHISL